MRRGHTILLALKQGISEYRYLQRVLRELFIHGGLTYNLLLMHAAVISTNNAGILIMGAEGTGKTDLSLKLCRLAGGEVISVDRCLAGLDSNDLKAWELPFGLNIYDRTLVDLGCDLRAVEEAAQPLGNEYYLDIPDLGMGKAEALKAAQSETRVKYPNPYYWAAFVLTGERGKTAFSDPNKRP
jgi:hypothetical protein